MARPFYLFLVFFMVALPQISLGCAVCYGDPSSPMTAGLNQAIIFLLGVVGLLLSIILSAIVYFYRRSKTFNTTGLNR
jgi:hypothetical protein